MRLAYIMSQTPGEMNRTMRQLAQMLAARGQTAVGAVQINIAQDPDAQCDMDLLLLPDGPQVCISQTLGPGSSGCRLNVDVLESAVVECTNRLTPAVDVAIVNKFGAHEAEGRGFRGMIAAALEAGIPVVVGVTAAKLDDFLAFSGGIAERLACDAEDLAAWCQAETTET